ncbi:hypothetical protein [Azonexus sp.]|uniref:hypothetical protein n=1 Tax=Azonexus sp. TaxID=1872668 RepID=UPI0027BA7898|nr:hypothetical protein [Azonexus sp.]
MQHKARGKCSAGDSARIDPQQRVKNQVNRWRASLLMLGSLLLFPSAVQAEAVILDSDVAIATPYWMRWMDEHRVIFLAKSGTFCERNIPSTHDKMQMLQSGDRLMPRSDQPKRNQGVALNRLAIFDTRTQKTSFQGAVGIDAPCYANGNIAYFQPVLSGGKCLREEWERVYGRLGEEKVQPKTLISPETCLPKSSNDPEEDWLTQVGLDDALVKNKRTIKMIRLNKAHGWLAMSLEARDYRPLAIYPPGHGSKPILIDRAPFIDWLTQDEKRATQVRFLRYETFRGAYLLSGEYRPEMAGQINPVITAFWWLYPDGRVEHVLTHRGAFGLELIPFKEGVLVKHFSEGLYQIKPDGTRRSIYRKGVNLLIAPTLSPGGCKMAFGTRKEGEGSPHLRDDVLRVIDLCTDVLR